LGHWPALEKLLVQPDLLIDEHRPRELLLDDRAALLTNGREARAIGEGVFERRGERGGVARLDEPAVLAGPNLVGQTAGAAGDHRAPSRHRFERHERAALVARRMDEERGRFSRAVASAPARQMTCA
jgi:hypothetical protein